MDGQYARIKQQNTTYSQAQGRTDGGRRTIITRKLRKVHKCCHSLPINSTCWSGRRIPVLQEEKGSFRHRWRIRQSRVRSHETKGIERKEEKIKRIAWNSI